MAIDQEALLAAIDSATVDAYGTDDQWGLSSARAAAIEYYLGMNRNPAPEGRSQVVDRSVYETISIMLPSLVRIFASSSDEVCKCVPIGPDDEQAAEQTTAVLNHYITRMNQWEQVCADWIHDAMLLSNGYCLAYWDEAETLVRERYEGQSDDQVAALMADREIKVLEHTSEVDEQSTADAQEGYQQAMQQYQQAMAQQPAGQPMQMMAPEKPKPVMKHDLVIEREENDDSICIKVLPPEHCSVSAATPDWTLKACPYFEYREKKTVADLRSMGLEVPEDISDDESDTTTEDFARNRYSEDLSRENDQGIMRKVWARMIWVRADVEGDSRSRLYYCIVVGRTVLYSEPCARIPVSAMTPQPLPHRHQGMSVAETVFDLQDIGTAIMRGGLDNLYLANNGRHVVSSQVNLEDMMDSRAGGVVRMLDDSLPGAGHIVPLQHPFAFSQIIESMTFFDEKRQTRTGAYKSFAGSDPNAANDGWKKTLAVQTQASMRVEHIARMMAPAVEALFSAVWEIISKHQNKPLTLQLKGKWITVDPQAWRTKRDIRISVGVGAGNKDSMSAQLNNLLAAQLQLMPMGLAGPPEFHATVVEMAKLSGFANPDRFWSDPTGKPPHQQPPMPEQIKGQTQVQIKQMELAADAQKFQAETQLRMQEIAAQNQAKIAELQATLQVQATNDERDSVREQQRAVMDAQIEQAKIESDQRMAVLKADMDKYKADLDAQVKLVIAEKQATPPFDIGPIQQSIQQLIEHSTAPTTIVRDQSGRAVGVQKGSMTRQIQRGPDGRAQGLQ